MAYVDIQNVPALLTEAFLKLQSKAKASQGDTGNVRKRRAAGISPARKTPDADPYGSAARYLYARLKEVGSPYATPKFIREETARLKAGTFNTDYWQLCPVSTDQYITATPTNAEDTAPPPYAYRDPLNRPTTPTYPAGTNSAGPIELGGTTTAELANTTQTTWRRTVFELDDENPYPVLAPLIWKGTSVITATASTRACRTFLSLMLHATTHTAGNPIETSLTLPDKPYTTFFYRFRSPRGNPPYFETTETQNHKVRLDQRCANLAGSTPNRATIITAIRPTEGHGYNNNTDWYTAAAITQELWQVKRTVNRRLKDQRWIYVHWKDVEGAPDWTHNIAFQSDLADPSKLINNYRAPVLASTAQIYIWQSTSDPDYYFWAPDNGYDPAYWNQIGPLDQVTEYSHTPGADHWFTRPDVSEWPDTINYPPQGVFFAQADNPP